MIEMMQSKIVDSLNVHVLMTGAVLFSSLQASLVARIHFKIRKGGEGGRESNKYNVKYHPNPCTCNLKMGKWGKGEGLA